MSLGLVLPISSALTTRIKGTYGSDARTGIPCAKRLPSSLNAITPPETMRKSQWFNLYQLTGNLIGEDFPPSLLFRRSLRLTPYLLAEEATHSETVQVAQRTWSENTVSLAKQWISNCVKFHRGCVSAKETAWYPTRLLNFDLHPQTDSQEEIRLIETRSVGFTALYTTLSHCWGAGPHFTLTKKTHAALVQGYPLALLPQFFQDAITVSRDLGVASIWIDTLCIFQDPDDKSDWEREASLMRQVYSNSYCNISAAHCQNSSEPMFGVRDPAILRPPVVEMRVSDEIRSKLLYAEQRRHRWDDSPRKPTTESTHDIQAGSMAEPFKYVLANVFWDDATEAVLNTRAWVVQERLLSPRILHFGKHQVLWECCSRCATEVYPDGFPDSINSGEYDYKSFISANATRSTTQAFNAIAAHVAWERIVTAYTACNLSFGSDKLVALSGIAASVKSVLMGGDDYLAGMWRRDIDRQLLWWVNKPVARPQDYRAPSWSWASIDGSVSPHYDYQTRGKSQLISVDAVHVEPSTADVTGALSDGWLHLRGFLKRIQLVRNSTMGWNLALGGLVVGEDRSKAIMLWTAVFFDTADYDDSQQRSEYSLFGMIASDDKDLSAQLLLFQVLNMEAGIFHRVGMALVGDKTFRTRLKERSQTDEGLSCVQYKDGLHLICVI